MAAALELAKLVSASFLHRNWQQLNFIMKTYLCAAVGILMCITSMGIFGYLSYAYQNTSRELKDTFVRLDSLTSEERNINNEIERVQKTINDIPLNRISRRLETQKELEPHLQTLQRQAIEVQMKIRNENLKRNSHQMEIGPVIYVAELLKANTDNVATYLILLFVIVFDPLAVALVLATTFAITERERLERATPYSADIAKAA
jgi:hypothetical protein